MKIYIYGTGLIAKMFTYHLTDEITIKGYIESRCEKYNFLQRKVYSPQVLNEDTDYDYVVIASAHVNEIVSELRKNRVSQNKVIVNWNEEAATADFDDRTAIMRRVAEDLYERKIEGAVAELGVYKGEFSQYINRAFPSSKLYLFDTFNGFDSRDVITDNKLGVIGKNIVENGLKFDDVEYVTSRLPYKENCIIKKGYFPESAKDVDDEFIFVNIDVDLFQPIYEGLKFFWPLMKKGGCIFVHDYGSEKWGGAKLAVRKFSEEENVSFVPIADYAGSVMFVK